MVLSTPGARVPRWRTQIWGTWLLSVNGHPVQTLTDIHKAFDDLSLSPHPSCTLLFAHPEIPHGISNKGLPILHRDLISQLNIDQLSDCWTPQSQKPPILPKNPTWDIVLDGDVRNVVTKAMKLTRGKLLKQDDWTEWNESEHLQLDQYNKQFMFGDPVRAENKSAIFHLVWTSIYTIKDLSVVGVVSVGVYHK
jgi:hypothetical protein